ncbi:MAG TPA: hypothetical protein VGF16_14590, partial [Bryobacteraceae bacterium]
MAAKKSNAFFIRYAKKASVPFLVAACWAQPAADWPMFNRDLGGTRYSPLTQINTRNVARLKRAWSYHLGFDSSAAGITGGSEFTPLVVNGVMYLGLAKAVVALEPETGKEIWRHDIGTLSRRSVAFWPGDVNNPPRIIFTSARKMIALNARTGQVDPGFGREGEVDLAVPYDSAPVVYKNFLFLGANTSEAP